MTFEVHRDQLSGYESLMADCGTGLGFQLSTAGNEDPFMSAPISGVEGVYYFCLPNDRRRRLQGPLRLQL